MLPIEPSNMYPEDLAAARYIIMVKVIFFCGLYHDRTGRPGVSGLKAESMPSLRNDLT